MQADSKTRICLLCGIEVCSPALIDEFLSVAPHFHILCDGCMEAAFLNGVTSYCGVDDAKLAAVRMSLVESRIVLSGSGIASMLS